MVRLHRLCTRPCESLAYLILWLKPGNILSRFIIVIKMGQQEQFFSIQQVSLKLKIPKPTLRYWEKELNNIICPLRTHGGQRRYNIEHISVLAEINKLRNKGLSISEIKRELGERISIKDGISESNMIDFLADHIAKIVRSEIYNFLHNKNSEKLEF